MGRFEQICADFCVRVPPPFEGGGTHRLGERQVALGLQDVPLGVQREVFQ